MVIVSPVTNPSLPAEAAWREAVKTAVRDPICLCRMLRLPDAFEQAAIDASRDFPVFAPLGYIARMQPGNPRDPLLRQVLPVEHELHASPGFAVDPVGDAEAQRVAGLLQKYHGRALMITTGACAVHCRYCFRRHYPYSEMAASPRKWDATIAEIAADRSIDEVILSGGDPLTLGDSQLADLAEMLADIAHLRRLRVHTRLPIVIPERVTDELTGWLRGTRLVPVVVVHANHPRELDWSVGEALAKLSDSGIPVLNQSVLLRGVNDDAAVLAELSRRLLDCRVLPYYLHQLDRVVGAAHFEVPVERGTQIVEQMRAMLPGYAVPRYVLEVSGEPAKRVLA
jgi:EF-P beta-lysylation protein EpmB